MNDDLSEGCKNALESLNLLPHVDATPIESRCVVRVKTTWWSSPRGMHQRKDITYLRRKCKEFNILEEDISNIGADEVAERFVNLDSIEDGVYEVVTTDHSYEWETGYLDDYNFELIPFTE